MPDNKKLLLDINIRFRDLDAVGHVNHLSILNYFEEGRVAFIQDILGMDLMGTEFNEKLLFIVADISCKFLSQISLNDKLLLEQWVGTIKNKSFTLKYKLRDKNNQDRVFAVGESNHVFFDFKNNRVIPAPAEFSQIVAEYVEHGDD